MFLFLLVPLSPFSHFLEIAETLMWQWFRGITVPPSLKFIQNVSSYHNKKNGRGSSNPSEINGFKNFSFFGFTLITLHNKKNGRGCCKPS